LEKEKQISNFILRMYLYRYKSTIIVQNYNIFLSYVIITAYSFFFIKKINA